MANIPELLDGHVTLEVECLDRLLPERVDRRLGGTGRAGFDLLRARVLPYNAMAP
jgi:hypothetical protein